MSNQPLTKTMANEIGAFEATHRRSGDLGGTAQGPGLSVYWRGVGAGGATLADVARALKNRVEFEQQTDELASNQKAKAMVLLGRVVELLEGRQPQTLEDGTPVID
ncbi:MAG: hypothetical protein AAFP90_06680 [Planctomycetota bacterium]